MSEVTTPYKRPVGRPTIISEVWVDFQQIIDTLAKQHPDEARHIDKDFWMQKYTNYILASLDPMHETVAKQQLKKYNNPTIREGIWNLITKYLTELVIAKPVDFVAEIWPEFRKYIKKECDRCIKHKLWLNTNQHFWDCRYSDFLKEKFDYKQALRGKTKADNKLLDQINQFDNKTIRADIWKLTDTYLQVHYPDQTKKNRSKGQINLNDFIVKTNYTSKKKSVRNLKSKGSGSTGKDAGSRPAGRSKVSETAATITLSKYNEFLVNCSAQSLTKDKIKKIIEFGGKLWVTIAVGYSNQQATSIMINEVVTRKQWSNYASGHTTYSYHEKSGTGYTGQRATYKSKLYVLTGYSLTLKHPGPGSKEAKLKNEIQKSINSLPEDIRKQLETATVPLTEYKKKVKTGSGSALPQLTIFGDVPPKNPGYNSTTRQAYKRKAKRWLTKFMAMRPAEQAFILYHLQNYHHEQQR